MEKRRDERDDEEDGEEEEGDEEGREEERYEDADESDGEEQGGEEDGGEGDDQEEQAHEEQREGAGDDDRASGTRKRRFGVFGKFLRRPDPSHKTAKRASDDTNSGSFLAETEEHETEEDEVDEVAEPVDEGMDEEEEEDDAAADLQPPPDVEEEGAIASADDGPVLEVDVTSVPLADDTLQQDAAGEHGEGAVTDGAPDDDTATEGDTGPGSATLTHEQTIIAHALRVVAGARFGGALAGGSGADGEDEDGGVSDIEGSQGETAIDVLVLGPPRAAAS